MKFKAAVLEETQSPLVIRELEVPPLTVGQALVKVMRSSICGKQIGEIGGHFGVDKFLPHLLGHEGGGIVVEIGEGVTQVKVDDHVVMHWRKGVGIESGFPKFKSGNLTIGAGLITTFAEYSIVSENRLTVIPNYISFDFAALMGCSVTTGLGLIINEAQLKIGQSIAVIGCGGVGLNVIQGAAMTSAQPIFAIDKDQHKLDFSRAFGSTRLLRLGAYDQLDKLSFDVVVETSGNASLIDKAYNMTAPQGKTILVGQPHYLQDITLRNMALNFKGKTIIDSQGGLTEPNEDIPKYLKLYQANKLKLKELITHYGKLEDIKNIIQIIKDGDACKCIIRMNE